MTSPFTRKYILGRYPEEVHHIINNALDWLDENEPKWKLKRPTNRSKYIKELLKHASRYQRCTNLPG